MATPEDGGSLVVGYVAGAHGIHGAIRIVLHDARSQALRAGATVRLVRDGADVREAKIRKATTIPGRAQGFRVQLDGVRTRQEAQALRGCTIAIDRAELPSLSEHEFYLADVIGAAVQRQREDGRVQALGTVVGVTSNGVQDLLEVEWIDAEDRRHRWLLLAGADFIRQADRACVRVELPPGFLPDALEDAP